MPTTRRHSITREIRSLRRTLRSLDHSLRRLAPMLMASMKNSAAPKPATGRKTLRLSRQRRAALKLHGRYLGYVRRLSARQKAQVRRVREAKGVRAAIARAKNLVGV